MVLIYGQEEYLIAKKLTTILARFDGEPLYYSGADELDQLLMEIRTISMFDHRKTIVISDHPLLSNVQLARKFLQEIVDEDWQNVNLIFVDHGTLSKTNPLVAHLLKNGQVHQLQAIKQKAVVGIIRDLVVERGGQISYGNALLLAAKLPLNLRVVVTEVEKLLSFAHVITEEIINESIGEYVADDYFAFSNAIINHDKLAIIKAYREKKLCGENFASIINQIAQALILALRVDHYKRQGLTLSEISKQTKIHIFRIKKSNELLKSSDLGAISRQIEQLSELDYKIKIGQIDATKGLDVYILNLIK